MLPLYNLLQLEKKGSISFSIASLGPYIDIISIHIHNFVGRVCLFGIIVLLHCLFKNKICELIVFAYSNISLPKCCLITMKACYDEKQDGPL